ncbi:hypothetical protein [Spiroplasma endosymbiont of Calodromius spilotus]|uniref:hypothetical protein n=1 Tax=Spiroplasma endosymbiont of Calodromius spilotus TaxID=3077929 RepID=UPI0031FEEEA9
MKKLLSLLSTITMASSGIPGILSNVSTKIEKILKNNTENNFLQTNNLKRNKRQTPPSLKNIITTINIGKIKKVNINSVIKRLSEINHPILSRQDFLENIEFEKITTNLAIVHFRNWEFAPFPRTLTFTINFDSDIVNLNGNLGIINENAILNLNNILNNRPETIARQFIERNDLDHLLTVDDLIVTNITTGSALIESSNINYLLSVNVIFMPRYLSLRTFITNTNLGHLETNSKDNIIKRLHEINNLNYRGRNIRLEVRNITRNSAEILFNQSTNSSSSLHDFHSTGNFDYEYTITITFTITKIDLSSVITNTDLGDIPNNSFQTIITEVIRANPNSGLTVNDLVVTRVTTNSATITSQNNNYFGNINVTFNNIKKIKSNQIYKLHDNDDDDDNNLNNSIEKRYRFLQPDQLKIIFKKEIWEKEIKPHIETIINIVSDINKFPISDYSLFEKYNEQDRNMTIGGVVYNYKTVDDYFKLDNTKYVTIDKQLGGGLKAFLSTDFYYSYFFDYILINNAQNNSIEKWYKFLQPDQLKISFNKEIWEKEIKPHIETIINIVSDINKFPISDYSLFEKYNEQDRNTLISFLICHFIEINDYFQSSNSLRSRLVFLGIALKK